MRVNRIIDYALIAVLVAAVIIFILAGLGVGRDPQAEADRQLDQYEALLAQCLERETISREECEAIARTEVFGSNDTTIVIPQTGSR